MSTQQFNLNLCSIHRTGLVGIALALFACDPQAKSAGESMESSDEVGQPCADDPADCEDDTEESSDTDEGTDTSDPPDAEELDPAPSLIDSDTSLASLWIAEGSSTRVTGGSVVRVTGDVQIDGELVAEDGPLFLLVDGNADISGTISATLAESVELDDEVAYWDQSQGVYVVVSGGLTIDDGAHFVVTGPMVFSDTEAELSSTLQADEVAFDDYSEDFIVEEPAFPLPPPPPDDPDIERDGDTWTVGGLIDFNDHAPGARLVLRSPARELIIDGLEVVGRDAEDGADADKADEVGKNARGRKGKRGSGLHIHNSSGTVVFQGVSTIQLGDGGNGGSASAACAKATGGDGNEAGSLRSTGRQINFDGAVNIEPGQAGHGGDASVTGMDGANGAPGEPGCDAGPANGGNGADQNKAFRAKGRVTNLSNVTIDILHAGNGGSASAIAGHGGDGVGATDGGAGGDASANGGDGGDASVSAGGLPIVLRGAVGGAAGDATTEPGNGGNGGDSLWPDPAGLGGGAGFGKASDGVPGTPGGALGTSDNEPAEDGLNGWQWFPRMLPVSLYLSDGPPHASMDGSYGVHAEDGDREALDEVTVDFEPNESDTSTGFIHGTEAYVFVEGGGEITIHANELDEESEEPFEAFNTIEVDFGELWCAGVEDAVVITVTDSEGGTLATLRITQEDAMDWGEMTSVQVPLGAELSSLGQIKITTPDGSYVMVGAVHLVNR